VPPIYAVISGLAPTYFVAHNAGETQITSPTIKSRTGITGNFIGNHAPVVVVHISIGSYKAM
jgi:hypothetical protein